MTREKLTVWDVDEDMHLYLDVLTVYEQIEVDKMFNQTVCLLDSYKMMKDLYGEDSEQAKEWLEVLISYIEEMRG